MNVIQENETALKPLDIKIIDIADAIRNTDMSEADKVHWINACGGDEPVAVPTERELRLLDEIERGFNDTIKRIRKKLNDSKRD